MAVTVAVAVGRAMISPKEIVLRAAVPTHFVVEVMAVARIVAAATIAVVVKAVAEVAIVAMEEDNAVERGEAVKILSPQPPLLRVLRFKQDLQSRSILLLVYGIPSLLLQPIVNLRVQQVPLWLRIPIRSAKQA